MRSEFPPLCGRDHLSFRSYYFPVKVRTNTLLIYYTALVLTRDDLIPLFISETVAGTATISICRYQYGIGICRYLKGTYYAFLRFQLFSFFFFCVMQLFEHEKKKKKSGKWIVLNDPLTLML